MGSIGANKNTATTINNDYFVDKSVAELSEKADSSQAIRDIFNLQNASTSQIDTLRRLIRDIAYYDKGYDEDKTPYNIASISIQELGTTLSAEMLESFRRAGMRQTKNPISIYLRTVPDDDRAIIRIWDEKEHRALIGPNGGLYTYTDNSKKKSLSWFEVANGRRTFK